MDLTTRRGSECYKNQIERETQARTTWNDKYGADHGRGKGWRPVEPFEAKSCSSSSLETPHTQAPWQARKYPNMFVDTVGDEGLVGGSPKKAGMMWDINAPYDPETIAAAQATIDSTKPPRELRKGPHDCYGEIGYGCTNLAASGSPVRHGRPQAMAAMYTQMPAALAMIWQSPPTEEEKAAKSAEAKRLAEERAVNGSFF